MLCMRCGINCGGAAVYCDACKEEHLREKAHQLDELREAQLEPKYISDGGAGFWWRFFAMTIDGGIQSLLFVLIAVISFKLGVVDKSSVYSLITPDGKTSVVGYLFQLSIFVLANVYYALFESSSLRATPGKLAFGLMVVDAHNERITFGRAFLRNITKIISHFTLGIGYLLVVFTRYDQTLHDKATDCYVEKKDSWSYEQRIIVAIIVILSSVLFGSLSPDQKNQRQSKPSNL